MISPHILPPLVEHMLMQGRDVKSKLRRVLNHTMFIDKTKYPISFFFLNLFPVIILRPSIQCVHPQQTLLGFPKQVPGSPRFALPLMDDALLSIKP